MCDIPPSTLRVALKGTLLGISKGDFKEQLFSVRSSCDFRVGPSRHPGICVFHLILVGMKNEKLYRVMRTLYQQYSFGASSTKLYPL